MLSSNSLLKQDAVLETLTKPVHNNQKEICHG